MLRPGLTRKTNGLVRGLHSVGSRGETMRIQKISVMLGLVLLLAVVAGADKVTLDYDHTVNFAKYKTV